MIKVLIGIAFTLLFSFSFAQVQGEHYVDGPMIGSVTDSSTSVNFILGTGNQSSIFHIELKDVTQNTMLQTNLTNQICEGDSCLYTSVFSNLIANNQYYAVLYKDNLAIDSTRTNVTVPDNVVNDFSFLIGSCANLYENVGNQRDREVIFERMGLETNVEFMLWLGDNIYLPNDGLTKKKMFDTYMYFKSDSPKRAQFMKHFFHFGIWDDHDYSYNDGASDFHEKESASQLFKAFWPHSGYKSQDANKGIYGSYKYEDAEFFLTDVRYHKSKYNHLGEEQLEWLKQDLLNSTATFKFIEIGSATVYPWFRTNDNPETSFYETGERDELFDFIYDNNISGVIFLSGDKHKSYLGQYSPDCNSTYPIHEFMCSPLTSGSNNSTYPYADIFYESGSKNYGKIEITGSVGNRECTMSSRDTSGNVLASISFNENDIKSSTQPDIDPLNHVVATYDFNNSAQDGSVNSFDAVLNGVTPTFDRWGNNSSAYLYNGYPQTIDFPNSVLNNKNNFTASFWIKPTESGNGLLSAASSTIGNEVLVYYGVGKTISLNIKNSSVLSIDTVRLNEWSHVVVTRDGFSGEAKIYINGKISARETLPTGALEVVANGLLVGNDQDGAGGGNLDPNQQFKGALDELYFYDEELCLSQIQELYKKGLKEVVAITNDTLCSAGNASFIVTGASQGNYKWYKTRQGNSLISNVDSSLNEVISESTTYWVCADNFWKESERVPVTIRVASIIYSDIDSLTYPTNLSSWFPFDGNAQEKTTGVNNGIVNGPLLTTGRFGNANSAYQFSNYEDLITIPSQTLDGAEEVTISFWMKTSSVSDGIVSAASSTGGNELLIFLSSAGGLSVSMNDGSRVYNETLVNDNQWHHILFSANCSLGLGFLYVDGEVAIGTNDYFKAGELEVPAGAFIIGNDQDTPGGGGLSITQQYVGVIDELKIYRRELNEEEVVAIYNDNTKYKEPFNFDWNGLTFCEGDLFSLNIVAPQKEVDYYLLNSSAQVVDTGIVINDSVYFESIIANDEVFSILVKNNFECEKTFDSTISVTAIGSPTPSISFDGDSLCVDIQGDSYNWILDGQAYSPSASCLMLTQDGSYSVYIVNNPNCISDTSNVYVHNTSSILELENKGIKLYPTPSVYNVTVEVDNSLLNQKYTVVDLNGKVVLNGKVESNNFTLNISELSSGLYNFVIESGNDKKVQLFQKVD